MTGHEMTKRRKRLTCRPVSPGYIEEAHRPREKISVKAAPSKLILGCLHKALQPHGVGLTDGQLLGRYVARKDDEAFAAWCAGTARWSTASAAACCATPRTRKTPSKQPSSSWPRRRPRVKDREAVGGWLHGGLPLRPGGQGIRPQAHGKGAAGGGDAAPTAYAGGGPSRGVVAVGPGAGPPAGEVATPRRLVRVGGPQPQGGGVAAGHSPRGRFPAALPTPVRR